MDREIMINIMIAAGYSKEGAERGLDLGTVIYDDLNDCLSDWPDTSAEEIEKGSSFIEKVNYNNKMYYIGYAN